MQRRLPLLQQLLLACLSFYLLVYSILEFYAIAWGSGVWWGEFSFKWGFIFLVFVLFCVFCLAFIGLALFNPARLRRTADFLLDLPAQTWFPALDRLCHPSGFPGLALSIYRVGHHHRWVIFAAFPVGLDGHHVGLPAYQRRRENHQLVWLAGCTGFDHCHVHSGRLPDGCDQLSVFTGLV